MKKSHLLSRWVRLVPYQNKEKSRYYIVSTIINDNGALHSDIAPRAIKEIINEDLDIPEDIKIVMYGRKTDIKKGVYYYVERMEENIRSKKDRKEAYGKQALKVMASFVDEIIR